jgi:DNA repair exonuclease SbcCD nuclease subunit
MFKFIHAADIHLDSPMHRLDAYDGAPAEEFRQAVRRAFENLIRLALAEKVAFVLIAGDLFDGDWKDYNTGLYFAAQMNRLHNAGIPVFIIAGNHDAAGRITRDLRYPENVRRFPSDRAATFRLETLRVAVHGQSFSSPAVKKDLSIDYPDPVTGWFNIGLLHTCATGREGHEPYSPCSPEALRNKGYDYWALGHIHQHEILSRDPPIVFSGNIQGRHIRETGPKGCVMVSVDDAGRTEPEFTPLDVVRWAVAEVTVSGAKNTFEVIDRTRICMETLLEENDGMPMAVRVHVLGETEVHNELLANPDRWESEIRAAANDIGSGRIWVEKIRFETRPSSSERHLPKTGAMGELMDLFDTLAADPSARRQLIAELDDLEKKIPPELKDGEDAIRLDDPQWSAGLLARVKPMLIRHLLRREGNP